MIGESVGPYRILAFLGRGGMGEVYRAEDTRLGRHVAVKFLPRELGEHEEAAARFLRESRAASALNHPHICTVHDVGEDDGRPYLVMELLEGASLREHIATRPGFEEVLELGLQLADALEAAHARGIVHRDLKPGNLFVTGGNRLKVLDFGLAKLLPHADRESSLGLTEMGSPLGTPQYMSPEQALGKAVDPRTDLFSAGAVLYELATGHRAFAGDTVVAVIDAILHEAPQPMPEVHPDLRRIIEKLLEKDPDHRYQTAKGLAADLRRLRRDTSATAPVAAPPRRGRPWAWALGGALLVAAGAAWMLRGDGDPDRHAAPRVEQRYQQLTFTGNALWPALSPDGDQLAYVERGEGGRRVLVRDVAGGASVEIWRGTWAGLCRWAPSGRALVCWGERDGRPSGYEIPRLGGAAAECALGPMTAWAPDGRRAAAAAQNMKLVRIYDGDAVTRVRVPGEYDWLNGLDWSPTEDSLALLLADGERERLCLMRADGTGLETVFEDRDPNTDLQCPRFSRDGDAVYVLRTTHNTSEIVKVTAGETRVVIPAAGTRDGFSVSRDGTRVVFDRPVPHTHVAVYERDGNGAYRSRRLTTASALVECPAVSPDGTEVAYVQYSGDVPDIHVVPVRGGAPRQVTRVGGWCTGPAWSPDGRTIAFVSTEGGKPQVWSVSAAGGRHRLVSEVEVATNGEIAWGPGERIVAQAVNLLGLVGIDPASGDAAPLQKSGAWLHKSLYSPDRSRLAVLAVSFMKQEIQVIPSEGGTPRVVARAPAGAVLEPLAWSPDGSRIHVALVRGSTASLGSYDAGDGSWRELGEVPVVDRRHGQGLLALHGEGDLVVGIAGTILSDIWMVENFDPQFARR